MLSRTLNIILGIACAGLLVLCYGYNELTGQLVEMKKPEKVEIAIDEEGNGYIKIDEIYYFYIENLCRYGPAI